MDDTGQGPQVAQGFRAGDHDGAARRDELLIPVVELDGAGPPLADSFQEGVALGDDAVVALELTEEGAIDLGEGEIEVAAARGRGAVDEFDVLGFEEDDLGFAHDIRGAFGDAVEAQALLDLGVVRVVAGGLL